MTEEERTVSHQPAGEEIRGSAPVMSARDLLLEVYHDMKFVRPAVEGLLAAGVVARVEAIERDHLARDAAGATPAAVIQRITKLEDDHQNSDASARERRRIGDLSGRALAMVIVVTNFILGLIVVIVNLLGAKGAP